MANKFEYKRIVSSAVLYECLSAQDYNKVERIILSSQCGVVR